MQETRSEIQKIHEKIITKEQARGFDPYIKSMGQNSIKVIPGINTQNQ
ncbi:hypothetical protein [Flagellimonas pelagia]|nr:hypothetical protein [Allomuricauda maritima]